MTENTLNIDDTRTSVVSRSSSEIYSTSIKVKRRQALFMDRNDILLPKSNLTSPQRSSSNISDVAVSTCPGCIYDKPEVLINEPGDFTNEIDLSNPELSADNRQKRNSMQEAVDACEEEFNELWDSDIDHDADVEDDLSHIPMRTSKRSESTENLLSTLITDNDLEENVLENIKQILNHESRHLDLLSSINRYKHILQERKVPDDVLWNIFHNIDQLTEAQRSLVLALENMILEWNSKRHSFSNLMDLYTFLHIKCKEYVKNVVNGTKELKSLFEKNHEFKKALSEVVFEGRKYSFENLLATPTNWLCNSIEFIKKLISDSSDCDRKVLEETLIKLKDDSKSLSRTQKPSFDQNNFIRSNLFVEYLPNTNYQRRLRHIFLFNTMIICAKQKLQPFSNPEDSKSLWEVKVVEKFDVKWFIPLQNLVIHSSKTVEHIENNKGEIANLKDKIREFKMHLISERDKLQSDSSTSTGHRTIKRTVSNNFSIKKMMIRKEMEKTCQQIFKAQTELLLLSPVFKFVISNGSEKPRQLLVPSIRDIETWKWNIVLAQKDNKCLISNLNNVNNILEGYRNYKQIIDVALWPLTHDDGVSGVLTVNLQKVSGLNPDYKYYLKIEVDSFKLTELKALTKILGNNSSLAWNESFDIELDCSLCMVILIYQIRSFTENQESLVGYFDIKLCEQKYDGKVQDISAFMLGNENVKFTMTAAFKLATTNEVLKREPSIKKTGLFGLPIKSIVTREKSTIALNTPHKNVPMILVACMERIENEGLDEEGIYRISGSKTEIYELRKKFNKNVQNTINNLSNYELHAITGIVKMYLRELPEPLMLTSNYRNLAEIPRLPDETKRIPAYTQIINTLPEPNRSTFIFLLNHFKKVCERSNKNQMVSGNLGLILGPTLILPPTDCDTQAQNTSQPTSIFGGLPSIAQETVTSMALAQVFTQIMNGYKEGKIQIEDATGPAGDSDASVLSSLENHNNNYYD